MPNLNTQWNTSKDSLTKKTKVGKDSRTTFWGFTVYRYVRIASTVCRQVREWCGYKVPILYYNIWDNNPLNKSMWKPIFRQSSLSMLQPRTTQQLFSHDKIQVDSRTQTSNTYRDFRARFLNMKKIVFDKVFRNNKTLWGLKLKFWGLLILWKNRGLRLFQKNYIS